MARDPAGGGFIGYPVSSPLNRSAFPVTWPGVQRSTDGIHWVASAPLGVVWGNVTPQSIEEGGFEAMELPVADRAGRSGSKEQEEEKKKKYFLIGGGWPAAGPLHSPGAYSMWVFSSDSVDGPYEPVRHRFRLSGGGRDSHQSFQFGALAAWVRGRSGELLISQYMTTPGRCVLMTC